jgi:hypothetical protein
MGKGSGIKWNGVTQVQTQNTIETIGQNVQIILRDPRTEQEWVTSSTDYINALVSLGVISNSGGSGWGLTGNSGTDGTIDFIGTTDAQPLSLKSNNIRQVVLDGTSNTFHLSTTDIGNQGDNYVSIRATDINSFILQSVANGQERSSILFEDKLTFSTNNLAQLTIDELGNVGIGTATPASKLTVDTGDIEIVGNANGLILESPDATRYRVTVANGGTLTVTAI